MGGLSVKKIVVSLVASMLVGCGSGDVCGAKSKCSGDPPRTQAAIDSCKQQAASSAKCSTEFTALGNCNISNQKCTADNLTEGGVFSPACASQAVDYAACISKP
jgi:hypothetical protein